jgi:lipopolysaccharide transport system permease protein
MASSESSTRSASLQLLPGRSGKAVGDLPEEAWSKVIEPQRGLFDIPWRELWRYRDLAWLLAKRDLATSYTQTVLGPLWFVLQPLLITVVFSYLFGRMAQFKTDDIPHYLFYMSGLVVWGFFSECVAKISRTFADNQQVFSKVYYPRLVAPLSVVIKNLVPLAIQFGLFLAGFIFYVATDNPHVRPNGLILLTPLLFLQTGMLGLGVGCMIAALTRRFRDLMFGVQVGLQLWMFGSAIVFPISRIAPDDRWIFFLNPIIPIIEAFRLGYTGVSFVEARHIALSAVICSVICFLGIVAFNRAEQTSMDTA